MSATKQIHQLLPRVKNPFPHTDVCNSRNAVKDPANLRQRSSLFGHQDAIKRLAATKRQENNGEASSSLSMAAENHRFFAFMTSLFSNHLLELLEYGILQRKTNRVGKEYDTRCITV